MTTTKKLGCGGCALWFFAGVGFLFIGVPVIIGTVSGVYHIFGNLEFRWQPSNSMEPTIHGSEDKSLADKLVIDKWAYRSKLPERSDIILFSPTETLVKESFMAPFVKRIVALPGEKVEIVNEQLYINGQPLVEEYLAPKSITTANVCTSSPTPGYLTKAQTIPPDSYLVMGDNRMMSYDGRCWGTVPKANIIGKITKIIKN
jgi:signal peptidase I